MTHDHGRAIRLCAAARGLSHRQVAARAGLSESFVSLAVKGRRPVARPTLERIAEALGCSVGLLDALASDDALGDYAAVARGVVGLIVAASTCPQFSDTPTR